MSLLWLDAFAAFDPDATLPTDQALEELHAALRSGRITARAVWVATGDRRDMGADEWHGLVLDTPPRNERVLLPYRTNTGTFAKQLESRWRDVLLPCEGLLAIWPKASVVQAETKKANLADKPATAAVKVGSSLSAPAFRARLPAPTSNGINEGVGPMQESCTIFHAIALLAYRDDAVAQRYGAKPGVRASGRRKRQEDVRYPTDAGMPGTEAFAGIWDHQRRQSLVRQWKEADKAQWAAAKAKLWSAVQSDDTPAFNTDGKIAREFWLSHDLDSPEAEYLRFRRSDLMRVMAEVPERVP